MEPTTCPLRWHYRPRQLVALAVLALCWLALLPLAFAAAAITAGTDMADRAITTRQHAVMHNPAYYSHPAQQRVWRVR